MSKSLLTTRTRQLQRFVLRYLSSELDQADLARSSTVFAPHPDDETLACGGTIIKKKRAGADVRIVFMTDGSYSPHNLMPAYELRAIRRSEALAACQLLGVEERDVTFLDFRDTELDAAGDIVIDRVSEILLMQPSQEVFIPYYGDSQFLDHLVTHQSVLSALEVVGRTTVVYEYPVWFWYRFWPWTSINAHRWRSTLRRLKKSLSSGLSLLKEFRCLVYIDDVLEIKRAALDQHKSQMTRLVPDSRWPVLGDVSRGEFLECFFREYELFYRHSLPDHR